jgi:hypothetical protein
VGGVSVVVTLNPVEAEVASVVGTARARNSRKSGFEDRSHITAEEERLATDINGAAAELAASKATGLRWLMSCSGEPGDLEGEVEVRCTSHEHGGLIVRERDRDGRIVLLVVGKIPTFRIVGWKRTEEARREEFRWRESWLVPQARLTPFTASKIREAA